MAPYPSIWFATSCKSEMSIFYANPHSIGTFNSDDRYTSVFVSDSLFYHNSLLLLC